MGGWEKLVVLDLRIGRIKHGRQSEEIFYVGKRVLWKEVLVVMCNIVHVDP